ncbi:hypothetical protein AJ80_10022 [Polytolypa hystricis UAMH7299]|uniref:Protein kinase domain-containing protein n=1 Tax=Polytolypa hystricis (strain UAMH7299) TaxID=1447883 RepID=A0A2B7WEV5_POLH7|nr:hypothetical protein AJ80_10022 [Polytolypa hystricis UAMH7299]
MDSRVQQLLAELEEQKRLREIAEAQAEKAEAQAEKERGLRQEEQRRREEEQRQREEAETLTADSTFLPFLHDCHELLLAIHIVTDLTRTTQGAVTKPTNWRVPLLITKWASFIAGQEAVWKILNDHLLFLAKKQFPTKHQLEYVCKVRDIVDRITEDISLKEAFGLRGSITFESHKNLGCPQESSLSEGVKKLSINPETAPSAKGKGRSWKKKEESAAVTGGQADCFCIYQQDGDKHIPAIVIEYKAPHKLTQAEMAMGLREEIRPTQDVISQESEDVTFCCRRLVAVVITQLFSYMVCKGVCFGYVCTGEAFIFVYIPDNLSLVQCALCIPGTDVKGTDNDNLKFMAVAQVLVFTIRALISPVVSQKWHDAAAALDVWPVEYSDILKQTLPSACLKHASPLYHGSSPSLSPPPSPSLTPHSGLHGRTRRGGSARSDGRSTGATAPSKPSDARRTPNVTHTPAIKHRPYCSQQCLLALRDSSPLDPSCPNYQDHRKGRVKVEDFRSQIRTQLARDRGPDADCRPLYKAGSCGTLLKVRLLSHRYTLVAKAVEYKDKQQLQHEMKVYNQLQDLQGKCTPVCLGIIKLVSKCPYYHEEKTHTHILLLSWAGEPIEKFMKLSHTAVLQSILDALKAIHSKGIRHSDAKPRNMLWDHIRKRAMVVDFEHATTKRVPLSTMSVNSARKERRLMKASCSKELQRVKAVFEGDAGSSL